MGPNFQVPSVSGRGQTRDQDTFVTKFIVTKGIIS